MTIEELRKKPAGILRKRSIIIKNNGEEYKYYYFLGKGEDDSYFIGFSDDGCYCSDYICEKDMVRLINNKKTSDGIALDIFYMDVHLSCD